MAEQNRNSIFQNDWWLDAVAPGTWDQVCIDDGAGEIAHLRFVVRKRYGFTHIAMPPFTQALGPWISPSKGKYAKSLGREIKLMKRLIESLPPHDYFQQNFHWTLTNWLPFRWAGFTQTTFYTYLLEDIGNIDALWSQTLPRVRTDVKKAESRFELSVHQGEDFDTLLRLVNDSFERQGDRRVQHRSRAMARLYDAIKANGAGQVFVARDPKGTPYSAALIAWDNGCAYYLMGGTASGLRNTGASSLLLWEAIQEASKHAETFDFEGSMNEDIERFFRGFGARQTPYLHVERCVSPALKAAFALRRAFA